MCRIASAPALAGECIGQAGMQDGQKEADSTNTDRHTWAEDLLRSLSRVDTQTRKCHKHIRSFFVECERITFSVAIVFAKMCQLCVSLHESDIAQMRCQRFRFHKCCFIVWKSACIWGS
jgi:hypothetical protein